MPVVGKQNALVVQCALPIEARSVAAVLKRARRGSFGLFQAWEGTMAGVPVLVVISGMGASEAAIAASEVIRLFEPCGLIDFGTAGAASESWAIGRCALIGCAAAYRTPRLIPQPNPDASHPPAVESFGNKDWLKIGQDELHLPVVRIGCSNTPVTSVFLARYLTATYGFEWFDCESHAVLDVAARHGIKALGLRVITDRCGPGAPRQFDENAPRVLRDAAKLLQKFVGALVEGGQLGLKSA